MRYPKKKAIENLRNTTEYLQFSLLGLCLASSEAVPLHGIEQVLACFGSRAVDLTDFKNEFAKDRGNQKRLNSTIIKLFSSGVSMAFNVAEEYYLCLDEEYWRKTKKWEAPYPYASQIRNLFSHGFFWHFHEKWIKDYEKKGLSFPIIYNTLQVEKSWHGRKAAFGDISSCDDLVQLVEDIISDISDS